MPRGSRFGRVFCVFLSRRRNQVEDILLATESRSAWRAVRLIEAVSAELRVARPVLEVRAVASARSLTLRAISAATLSKAGFPLVAAFLAPFFGGIVITSIYNLEVASAVSSCFGSILFKVTVLQNLVIKCSKLLEFSQMCGNIMY